MCSRGTRTDRWIKASATNLLGCPNTSLPSNPKYGKGGRKQKLNRVGHTRIYAWGVVLEGAYCEKCSRTRHETVRPKLT